jgi:hypothetical protein
MLVRRAAARRRSVAASELRREPRAASRSTASLEVLWGVVSMVGSGCEPLLATLTNQYSGSVPSFDL